MLLFGKKHGETRNRLVHAYSVKIAKSESVIRMLQNRKINPVFIPTELFIIWQNCNAQSNSGFISIVGAKTSEIIFSHKLSQSTKKQINNLLV